MPTTPRPILTIQTASLWASGDTSTFTGTGSRAAYDPFLGGFSSVISSAGLVDQPFADEVYNVDAGDQVTFVIAVQNFSSVSAYDVKLRDVLPVGFVIVGNDLTVTDGAGNPLGTTGNLFDPNGGLILTSPLPVFDAASGANVLLLTFTATATSSVLLPVATVTNNAQIVSYADIEGGPNLSGSSTTSLSATTPVQTGAIVAESAADQPAATLQAGQTASFDITVTLPEGTTQDLRIDQLLPQVGSAWLQLVSAQILSVGAHLSATLPLFVQPNGAIYLGNVTDVPDNLVTGADQLVIRLTVRGGGTTSGQGAINTVISAIDPNNGVNRLSVTVTNTVALGTPDVPPTIAATSGNQYATNSTRVLPFAGLVLTDPDAGQLQTLTIHLSDASLGALSGPASLTAPSSADYSLTGTVAVVQAAARALLFTPNSAAVGTETFSLTLDDGVGGVATSQGTTLTLAPAAHPSDLAHFPISTQTVLTSTATGTSTYAQVETYVGAVDHIGYQFLYDGDTTLAIVAQQSGMLISSMAQATAIQLQGGANVLNMLQGSSFLVSGPGDDTIILHADQPQTTWNTIANFHLGDSITIYGFTAGTSSRWWDAKAGAPGYTGSTLRLDINGDGQVDSSLTFANQTNADTGHFALNEGSVAGLHYLTIAVA